MAHIAENPSEVERLSAIVLSDIDKEDPDFLTTILFRIQALHQLHRHEEEIQQAQGYSSLKEVEGEGLVHLLSHLVREHPGKILWTGSIKRRLNKLLLLSSSPPSEGISLEELIKLDEEAQVLYLSRTHSKLASEKTTRALGEAGKL